MMGPDSHEDWQALIPEYLSGVLSADEKTALDGHLLICSECRSVLEDARRFHAGLSQLAREAQSNHPTSDQINEYANAPDVIESSLRETISRHLALCPRCAGEVATLEAVARELAEGAEPDDLVAVSAQISGPDTLVRPDLSQSTVLREPKHLSGGTSESSRFGVRPRVIYALAAVFVALLAYPAYRWITLPTSTDSSVVGTVYNLAPQTRGGLRPSEIHVQPSDATVEFALNTSTLGEYQPRLCVLKSKSEELLRAPLAAAISDDQAIRVTVPARLLPNGNYTFSITGVNKTNASDTLVVHFPFIVRPDTL